MLNKMKRFLKDRKGILITTGLVILAGICYFASMVKSAERIPYDEENHVDLEDDECLVDGVARPLYENGDDTRIYDYAFINDQVKEEFREAGYTIVESS
jgi:hypothetical protein